MKEAQVVTQNLLDEPSDNSVISHILILQPRHYHHNGDLYDIFYTEYQFVRKEESDGYTTFVLLPPSILKECDDEVTFTVSCLEKLTKDKTTNQNEKQQSSLYESKVVTNDNINIDWILDDDCDDNVGNGSSKNSHSSNKATEASDKDEEGCPDPTKNYFAGKFFNISHRTSIPDIQKFLKKPDLDVELPSLTETAQCIHVIIMDKFTGYTPGVTFVEFQSQNDFIKVMMRLKDHVLKGEKVGVGPSSQEGLFSSVFPTWKGEFIHGVPATIANNSHNSTKAEPDNEDNALIPLFLMPSTEDDTNYTAKTDDNSYFLANHCSQCPERPYENLISMVVKFPGVVSIDISWTMERNLLFENYKFAIEIVISHINYYKHACPIDITLLPRMLRVCLMSSAFTRRQKLQILTTSKLRCPKDIFSTIHPTPQSFLQGRYNLNDDEDLFDEWIHSSSND
ncbi:hypothetical protein BDA99DRAFT_531970 [Phascolomyces articulosus]|uniref:RRM domain-containing protein n=1 Tax=Phascolomyces articulosus TaxID=60185 RepID=A0AAD5KAT7_9FUNG|nr:hypothetical protein BDA99DRAFT_531970 [Phascolomyces articulosus]